MDHLWTNYHSRRKNKKVMKHRFSLWRIHDLTLCTDLDKREQACRCNMCGVFCNRLSVVWTPTLVVIPPPSECSSIGRKSSQTCRTWWRSCSYSSTSQRGSSRRGSSSTEMEFQKGNSHRYEWLGLQLIKTVKLKISCDKFKNFARIGKYF